VTTVSSIQLIAGADLALTRRTFLLASQGEPVGQVVGHTIAFAQGVADDGSCGVCAGAAECGVGVRAAGS
jgi:hypothetical protein